MTIAFYVIAAVAVVTTILVIVQRNAVHALLLFIVSLLSVALLFYLLGAPFVAALEVVIYAGAIMVMFLFVVMMLNLGPEAQQQERRWLPRRGWVAPGVLCAVLFGMLSWMIMAGGPTAHEPHRVEPAQLGYALFGPYIWGVHVAALLLLSGLIGASHLRRHESLAAARSPSAQAGEPEPASVRSASMPEEIAGPKGGA